jgi:hypothetical protein
MAHKKDNIPTKDSEFDDFYRNIVEVVDQKTGGNVPDWKHIPPDSLNEFHDAWNAWTAAYEKIKGPHTSTDTAEKNRIRDSSKKNLREFINRFLRYPPVTAEDRANMGISEHDTTRTAIGVPQTRPEFSIVVKDIRRLALPFKDQGSASRARPYGLSGAVVRWAVLDKPPAGPGALTNSKLATRTPFILNFTEEERGKTVYIAMQWQNEKGDVGGFSEIQSAVIP